MTVFSVPFQCLSSLVFPHTFCAACYSLSVISLRSDRSSSAFQPCVNKAERAGHHS